MTTTTTATSMPVLDGRDCSPVGLLATAQTHDNGDRAFEVTFDRAIRKLEAHRLVCYQCAEACLSLDDVEAIYLGIDTDAANARSLFDGCNTVLAICGGGAAGKRYAYLVSQRIVRWELAQGETVHRFLSPLRGSDVPYPVLYTSLATYTACGQDDVRLPNCLWSPEDRDSVDAYTMLWSPFHGFLYGVDDVGKVPVEYKDAAAALFRAHEPLTSALVEHFALRAETLAPRA